jgi:hypothetical protein
MGLKLKESILKPIMTKNQLKTKIMSKYSNCCGAPQSWLSDSLCSDCHEHAEFYTQTEDQED